MSFDWEDWGVGEGIRTTMYWCLHCERVQLVPPRLRVDYGDHDCVTPGCGGGGTGIDLYPWAPGEPFVPYRDGVQPGERVAQFSFHGSS